MNDNQSPSADQQLVTHEDRDDLDGLRSMVEDFDSDGADRKVALLDRLIAAAEADKPALPEGWVRIRYPDGSDGVWYYPGHGDHLQRYSDGTGDSIGFLDDDLGNLTPLVTAASIAPEGWHVDEDGENEPTIWEESPGRPEYPMSILRRCDNPAIFDVLAALVSAAQAERGESR